jgi:hypothetical protein
VCVFASCAEALRSNMIGSAGRIRATVSGIGGFCVPNQFYNPRGSAKGARKPRGVRAYEMPYDPYPWCADYSDGNQ